MNRIILQFQQFDQSHRRNNIIKNPFEENKVKLIKKILPSSESDGSRLQTLILRNLTRVLFWRIVGSSRQGITYVKLWQRKKGLTTWLVGELAGVAHDAGGSKTRGGEVGKSARGKMRTNGNFWLLPPSFSGKTTRANPICHPAGARTMGT